MPKTVRILAMSDIHDDWNLICAEEALVPADICVLAGDLTDMGVFRPSGVFHARAALGMLSNRYRKVLWIPGNHDFGLDGRTFAQYANVHCLLDGPYNGPVTIQGVSLSVAYNMPNLAYTWCHMTADPEVENRAFDLAPCDILVSHSPPFGVCDADGVDLETKEVCHIGSRVLTEYIERCRPKIVICGHAHGGSGSGAIGETTIVNVARRVELLEVTF